MNDLVDDTSPQLGGTLDPNSQRVSGDWLPQTDSTHDLGSATYAWAQAYVDELYVGGDQVTALTDPGADSILIWDDSAGNTVAGTVGSGLTISGTTVSVDSTVATLTGTQTLTNKTLTDPKVSVTNNAQTGTSYTGVLSDASKAVTMDNASANTFTIPTNASVSYPTGTVIVVQQIGAGTTTITGASGVTVNGVSAGSGDLAAQWSAVSLLKTATNTWLAMGDIGAVS